MLRILLMKKTVARGKMSIQELCFIIIYSYWLNVNHYNMIVYYNNFAIYFDFVFKNDATRSKS